MIEGETTAGTAVDHAEALQTRLAVRVEREDRLGHPLVVSGLDVAYDEAGRQAFAAAVAMRTESLQVVQAVSATSPVTFPYVSGLFSFREVPPLLAAIANLASSPELLLCEGHGIAHPRRCGLASHLGVLLDTPSIGCAKTCLVGEWTPPEQKRGSWSALVDRGETVGVVLRTQTGVKPVFVSVGHRVSLATACRWVLALSLRHRLPEPLRLAHEVSITARRRAA